uniref:Uncharacterized protein n=1 Tax=Arundo donax TaxID=35708 RepID=A0A0A9FU29_ARUDO
MKQTVHVAVGLYFHLANLSSA